MDPQQTAADAAAPSAVPEAAPPPQAGTSEAAAPAQAAAPARPAQAPPVAGAGRGRRKGTRRSASAAQQQPEELVKLGPEVARNSERLRTGWHPVRLSPEDKAADVELDGEELTASSRAGYRMVRATHGACSGTWYFEVRISKLGPTGAARVGWATRKAELNAPVGADEHGYSYRSSQGSKVHKAWRDEYGQPFGEGDVVGCLLHLGEGGRPFEQTAEDAVKHQGKVYFSEAKPAEAQPLAGSFVAFSLNGVLQGKAYTDLSEGTYYPALSLYTNKAQQTEAAQATTNFGEQPWAFPPPAVSGCPPPRPACELSGPEPGSAAAAAAAAAAGMPAAGGAAAGTAAGGQPRQDGRQAEQQPGPAGKRQKVGQQGDEQRQQREDEDGAGGAVAASAEDGQAMEMD